MTKVIELEDLKIKQCPYCKSYVQYDDSDLKGDYEFTGCGTVHWTYVTCPKCKAQIQF